MFFEYRRAKRESGGAYFEGSQRKRIGPRVALVAGFSALLALMATLAFDAMGALRELEASNSRVRSEYLSRERTLQKIRVSIYESGNLLREYALTNGSQRTRDSYVEQLSDMRKHANAAMETCVRQSPPDFQDLVRKLAREMEHYWRAANHTLSENLRSENQAAGHRAALSQRAAVLSMTSELSRVNELELRQAELEISNLFAKSRGRLQNFAALAIGIGLVLAVACISYVFRLQNRARDNYLEGVRYHDELMELSRRLAAAEESGQRVISKALHDEITHILGALLIHAQDLLDDPQAIGTSRIGLQKIRVLAADANRKLRSAAAVLNTSAPEMRN